MVARTETRTQRRTAETRRAVVEAAQAILASHGMSGFTVEAVAERADVAIQTVYNRVGGRSALLNAVSELAMEKNRGYMDAAYAAEGTHEERLRLVAAAYIQFARDRPQEFRLLADPPDEPATLGRIATLIEAQNTKLASLLREGIASGTIRADIDPDQAATSLWAMMNGLLALGWRADSQLSKTASDQLLRTSIQIIFSGLKPVS